MPTNNLDQTDIYQWWEAKRWEYNKGLLISGAFSLAFTWLAVSLEESAYLNIGASMIVIIAFLVFYGLFMAIGNMFYYAGFTIDSTFSTRNDEDIRHFLFTCGYWLSVMSIPAALLIYIAMLIASVPDHSYQPPA